MRGIHLASGSVTIGVHIARNKKSVRRANQRGDVCIQCGQGFDAPVVVRFRIRRERKVSRLNVLRAVAKGVFHLQGQAISGTRDDVPIDPVAPARGQLKPQHANAFPHGQRRTDRVTCRRQPVDLQGLGVTGDGQP